MHKNHGRVRCAVLISPRAVKDGKQGSSHSSKPGFIQISPAKEGPWTSVRLNYAAPAACWRLGYDVIASEVTVKDGNRYVSIRSLVSITNNTDFVIELRLKSKSSKESISSNGGNKDSGSSESDQKTVGTEEFFEIEKYSPSLGWISCSQHLPVSSQSKPESSGGENQVKIDISWLLFMISYALESIFENLPSCVGVRTLRIGKWLVWFMHVCDHDCGWVFVVIDRLQ